MALVPRLFPCAVIAATLLGNPTVYAQETPVAASASRVIVDGKSAAVKLKPSSGQVTAVAGAMGTAITIAPGTDGYPGISLAAEGKGWDLSAFGHIEAKVVNTGTKAISLALRVDNAGDWKDNPWNTESLSLQPGESGVVRVIFGYSYGRKPGYKLKASAITNLVLFAIKSEVAQSFRLESIVAGGVAGEKPPVPPDAFRETPRDGILLGKGTTVDAATQIAAKGVTPSLVTDSGKVQVLRAAFPSGDATVSVKPAKGRWDLREYNEVRVTVRNAGKTAVTPRVRLETNGGQSAWVAPSEPLAPGATGELAIPFASATPANLTEKGTGSPLASDATAAVTVGVSGTGDEKTLLIESIQAVVAPAPKLPDWLGKRPPVAGEWVKTLDDEFNGTSLDSSVWSIYGANYWDKQSHWSKENVFIGGGVVKLRYTKKTGFNNDDPKEKSSDYASGYLHSYGLWRQRYGYFEARMKLPKAPGLWPAFWMMPDRGPNTDPQWKRQDTANGGMEFDIMEHLTRWGPNRYNIAMHYDGYEKNHKSIGTDKIYLQPDKDGFITCGLLWTPGSAIYYAQGQEVARWENSRISNVPGILMFTLPMGGWDNSPLEDAKLPDDFVIDYVRVWQRKDLASPTDGKATAK